MKKRKTGFLTWLIAALLFLAGAFLLAEEFVPGMLPEESALCTNMESLKGMMIPYVSMNGTDSAHALMPLGIFSLVMGALLIIYRRRKPYSILFWVYLWWVFSSFMFYFRLKLGVVDAWHVTELVSAEKIPLMTILLVLEVFLGLILMYLTGTLDQKWRAKEEAKAVREEAHERELRIRGEVPQEMQEEERPVSRHAQKKAEKRRLKAEAKAENKRAREEEERKIKEEEEAELKEEREKAEEEEANRSLEKELARQEKIEARKQKKLDKKNARKAKRNGGTEEEELGDEYQLPANEYVRDLPGRAKSIDEPISFPEVRDIPRLETIEHSEDIDLVAPDPQKEFRASFGLMNSMKEEFKRGVDQNEPVITEKSEDEFRVERPRNPEPVRENKISDHYKRGSMLEATLEGLAEVDTSSVDRKSLNLSPIIGLDDPVKPEANTYSGQDSFAPSTLSKDHPRYKMFESLQRPPEGDNSNFGTPTEAPAGMVKDEKPFAPSNLPKDHPRYKLFESLKNSGPGRTNVSHVPGMPFQADAQAPQNVPTGYSSTYLSERAQQESLSSRLAREKMESVASPASFAETVPQGRVNQNARPQIVDAPQYQAPAGNDPYQENPACQQGYAQPQGMNPYQTNPYQAQQYQQAPQQGYQQPQHQQPAQPQQSYQQPQYQAPMQQAYQPQYEPPRPVETPVEERRYNPSLEDPMGDYRMPKMEARPVPPAHEAPSAPRAPMRNEEIQSLDDAVTDDYDTKINHKEQENELLYSIGISGLSSQDAGMSAVAERARMTYTAPTRDILVDYPTADREIDYLTRERGDAIISCFEKFKIHVTLDNIIKGPTVTMYEIKLGEGIPVSKVKTHNEDIMYALGIRSVRILAPVPGKQAIGIEVPNTKRATIGFKDMLYAFDADESSRKMAVPMILGRTVTGEPVSIDVAKTPHLLIAGSTGSGKSVGINSLIATILYNKSPRDVRLIMVDPKVVELKIYNGIPHLLTPVITEAKRVKAVLAWLTEEMDRRYEMLSRYNVRNIVAFNEKLKKQHLVAERLPYIVLIMDEYADLMTTIGKDIEYYVGRLTAMARAVGIHLVLATQRPDADVVTGIIKANIPSRIAFAVGSGVNSRIILDELGAESLLGKGDMLYRTPSSLETVRIQGAFLSDGEVEDIVEQVKRNGEPDYLDESIFEDPDEKADDDADEWEYDIDPDEDEYEQAKQIVYERKCASASYLQRRMKIGYNKAARFVERMEEEGIIGPPNGSKPRELIKMI